MRFLRYLRVRAMLIAMAMGADSPFAAENVGHDLAKLRRILWLHASLAVNRTARIWGTEFPACPAPADQEIHNAAGQLTGQFAVDRLYLIYHHEMPLEAAERVYTQWRLHCPAHVQIVPALLLRMYDPRQSTVFTPDELRRFVEF